MRIMSDETQDYKVVPINDDSESEEDIIAVIDDVIMTDPVLRRDEILVGDWVIMLKGAKQVELGRVAKVVKTTRGLVYVEYPDIVGVVKTKKMLLSNVLRLGAGLRGGL